MAPVDEAALREKYDFASYCLRYHSDVVRYYRQASYKAQKLAVSPSKQVPMFCLCMPMFPILCL